jgi:TPM domain
MLRHCRWAVLALLCLASQAGAVAPEVKDEGKFFSADAVKKANEQILELARRTDRDLLIETFAAVPADKAEKVKGLSAEERGKFFRDWAEERMRRAAVNGVYVLACKEPSRLEVGVSARARSVFDRVNHDRLTRLLLDKFRAKKYDDGLLEAVKLVNDTIRTPSK